MKICPACRGYRYVKCPVCGGSRKDPRGDYECSYCRGSGTKECRACEGTGYLDDNDDYSDINC